MIKATLTLKEQKGNDFPKLVTHCTHGGVFLALSRRIVICLDKGKTGWDIGDKHDQDFTWNDKTGFVDYEGSITLQNVK